MKTDFLQRLVARSFDPAESLSPRPAALFEPARPIGGLPLVTAGDPYDDGAPEPEPSPLRRSASEVAPPPARLLLPEEPGSSAPRRGKPATADPAQARSDRGAAPPTDRRPAPAELFPQERDAGEPAVTERSLLERVSREVVVERRPDPPRRRAPSLSAATPDRPAASEPSVHEVVVERFAEVPQPRQPTMLQRVVPPPARTSRGRGDRTDREIRPPPPPSRPRPPVPVVVEPRVEPSRRRDEPPAAAPAATPPAVHVTIGRVEVRAFAAPAEPAERSRPRPNVMSLDEYLEQRSDGGRR